MATEAGVIEIMAEVQWSVTERSGNRFFHVRHEDGSPPTISEAIDMVTLLSISKGKQRMRGFADLPAQEVVLEVWSDVDTEYEVVLLGIATLIPRSR